MKIGRFSPPANVDDFGTPALLRAYSDHISAEFDRVIASLARELSGTSGTPQFYNPVTHGITDPDTAAEITWDGFPRRFMPQHPGSKPNYQGAEPDPAHLPTSDGTRFRPQDEYLEWFAHRDASGKIVRVDFTCEAYDYYEFLGQVNPDSVVALYRKYIDPAATKADLFVGNQYNPWNSLNLDKGAMHLTHPANALGAEIKLAGDGTIRRKSPLHEPTSAAALIKCSQFGDPVRNSDPKIGFEINRLARQGLAITLADPVGLYMSDLDDSGFMLADGRPATGFFTIKRGHAGRVIRASYELPANLKAEGLTVSDVQIAGVPISFGGQIAERITMVIPGVACRPGSIINELIPCVGAAGAQPEGFAAAEGGTALATKVRSRRA